MPNLLSGDKVQAAMECAKGIQLRLTWRNARGGPLAQAAEQHEDANLAESLLQLSSTIDSISGIAGRVKDALGCVASYAASTYLMAFSLLPFAWCRCMFRTQGARIHVNDLAHDFVSLSLHMSVGHLARSVDPHAQERGGNRWQEHGRAAPLRHAGPWMLISPGWLTTIRLKRRSTQ